MIDSICALSQILFLLEEELEYSEHAVFTASLRSQNRVKEWIIYSTYFTKMIMARQLD